MIPGIAPVPAAPPVASPPQPRHMFVFGAGFVGRYVSERLLAQGWQISGTCTSPAKKRELEVLGMKASVFDATESSLQSIHSLQQATHLLISIPPIPGFGDPLLNLNEDLRRILSHGNLEWLCYLSSTSVYGDCGGALVDEDHMVNPKSESAKLRYEAEKGWLNLVNHLNLSAFIFRLGGIYGPGRSALDTLAKNNSLSQRQKMRESKQYTARIHVADIYQAVLASMSTRCARKIFNVVDDDPAPRAEVFAFARSLIEMRHPDLITESPDVNSAESDIQERILPAEKRVSNARMKKELGVKLLHPTYRSGLQSILDSWQTESQLPDRSR
ncbi:uncharacterized protein LOC120673964 isoform X2 [Panicum virgatum]|uniref:uncharacterized protein LOC120673964 isoform X2 n=1 Tax=Panicum virgatum TaxID=38727 RepID=UPI0019D58DF6|nr:uncharacterized protein LOC120673964 isoform X2 [Panicum virgatum]